MSELPIKKATVNDRNSTPTSTAILLWATGRSPARTETAGAVVMARSLRRRRAAGDVLTAPYQVRLT